jgi:ubiquinone/menaquinone biosynthesis C-methylase UbiE
LNRSDAAYAGQEVYSRAFLRIYDPVILGFYGNVVWRCPTSRLVEQYRQHVGHTHLDVGPGTGYFLAHTPLPDDAQITLLDPNPDVLAHAARRLSDRHPSAVQADVLKPLPLTAKRFDSVALNYVLHCLPGPPVRKAAAVQNVAAVLKPGGVLFGATVLGATGPHTWLSRAVLRFVNSRRILTT